MGQEPGRVDVLRGTLDLLVLRTLATGPRHGLGISRRIEEITRGTFEVTPGSLFPALRRLEDRGFVKGEWGESETRRKARFYSLTRAGERRLGEEKRAWRQILVAVGRVLEEA
ncbi:MAG TPA: PadR family transcriptional regulator [Vicinamibacteria bacterium]|nr:PadR family transcriptional regulator [Vicinamibacteria bacterium]